MEVRFCGRLPRPETLGRIAEAHVLVLPSVCPENGPMSLLEALAVGTNVLTTDLGGAGEIVRDSGVGFLIRPDDAESLEAALQGIDQAFADGSLNGFEVSAYLAGRSEEVYIEQLMELYTTELPESYGEGI